MTPQHGASQNMVGSCITLLMWTIMCACRLRCWQSCTTQLHGLSIVLRPSCRGMSSLSWLLLCRVYRAPSRWGSPACGVIDVSTYSRRCVCPCVALHPTAAPCRIAAAACGLYFASSNCLTACLLPEPYLHAGIGAAAAAEQPAPTHKPAPFCHTPESCSPHIHTEPSFFEQLDSQHISATKSNLHSHAQQQGPGADSQGQQPQPSPTHPPVECKFCRARGPAAAHPRGHEPPEGATVLR